MAQTSKFYIAADHAGFDLKQHLIKSFPELKIEDLGTHNPDRVDYPDFADRVASKIESDPNAVGILVCGSGQGMAIRANRYPKVRAALCWSEEVAQLSREHNNANILCVGSRFTAPALAELILKKFLSTEFEGGRHSGRVDKLSGKLSGKLGATR